MGGSRRRARVRAGAAAVAAPLTPACLGALCLCPTMLCAGGRAGEREGKWAGLNELRGGARARGNAFIAQAQKRPFPVIRA